MSRDKTTVNPLGLPYLQRRAITPAGLGDLAWVSKIKPQAVEAGFLTPQPDALKPDLNNIQGDVFPMFPKKFERFIFFTISQLPQFRKDLDTYRPRVISAAVTVDRISKIHDDRTRKLDFPSSQIAFSKVGLRFLEKRSDLEDIHFDKGPMCKEKAELGDGRDWDTIFKDGKTHGVILITAKCDATCDREEKEIRNIFGNSTEGLVTLAGRVRFGDGEHFGWRDGISQPALEGLCDAHPGQRIVPPGVIIMGHEGDPVRDDPRRIQRPSFTKDGTFMVFRKLEQDVLNFEDYIERNWRSVPDKDGNNCPLDEEQRKELFGARMLGRFKSGAPLALTPYRDDSDFLTPDKINYFDYTEGFNVDHRYRPPNCPFAAHIRKTAPRNLDPLIRKEYLDASMIIRTGIPYGPDVTEEERKKWEEDHEPARNSSPRGLLFVCYQSSIENGFFRQTTRFANNNFFPTTSLVPINHGPDPIISGPPPVTIVPDKVDIRAEGKVTLQIKSTDSNDYAVTGFASKVDTSATAFEQDFFVTSRGGEYFFVPSISTLHDWGAAGQKK